MEYSKEDKKKYLILQCRYYNGESNPPSSLPANYIVVWNIEKEWLGLKLRESNELHQLENLSIEYHLAENREKADKTPETLIALLFKHFSMPFGDLERTTFDALGPLTRAFFDWYESVYLLWETNHAKRANKRKIELITKCRYYKGEEKNPWEDCNFNIVLGFRRDFWEWEKNWVERNAQSYSSTKRFPYLSDLPTDFFDRYEGAKNLYKHILNTHCGFLFHTSTFDFFEKNMRYFIEDFYLKMTPLGKGAAYYYSYYMGGESDDNPYKGAKKNPERFYCEAWTAEYKYHHEIRNTLEEFYLHSIARCHLEEIKQTGRKRWHNESELPCDYMALVFHFDQVMESIYRIDDSSHLDKYREGVLDIKPYLI